VIVNSNRLKRTILLFFAALVIVAFVGIRYLPARGVQKQLAAIRTAGLPTSSAELDAWYKPVPKSENQALAILEAAKVRSDPTKGVDPNASSFGSLNAGQEITPQMESVMTNYLAQNAEALEMLDRAAELQKSRYPMDLTQGASTLLPHLAQIKGLIQLLRIQAVQQSHIGNREGAVRAVITALAITRSLREEPLLISDLVRIACVAITLNALERTISEHQLTKDELVNLSRKIAEVEADGGPALYRAMAGERAGGISTFELSFSELERLSNGSGPQDANEVFKNLGYQAYRLSGMRQRDLSLYLEMMNGFVNSTKLGYPDALRRTHEVENEMSERFSHGLGRLAIFSRMLLPALSKAAVKDANLSARCRYAEVALAIEQYRLEHQGRVPESLDELAPKYLFKVPLDPFEGQALVYERLSGNGYRISSPSGAAKRSGLNLKQGEEPAFQVLR